MTKTAYKVKAHGKEFKMKIAPRELTAIFVGPGDRYLDPDPDDYALMLINCPCPNNPEIIKEIKTQVQKKLESMDLDQIQEYLKANRKEQA